MTSASLRPKSTRWPIRLLTLGAAPLSMAAMTTAHAGNLTQAGSSQPVIVEIDVHLAFPPTQGELDDLAEKLDRTSRVICDATDGGVHITRFNVRNDDSSARNADMHIYPPAAFPRSMVTGVYPFFTYKPRVLYTHFGSNAGTWGHEFGHFLFGLKDQYDSQRFLDGPCGITHAIDDADTTDQVNSIMGHYGARCWNSFGSFPTASLPDDFVSNCTTDADCGAQQCWPTVPWMSEFGTADYFETTNGWSTLGSSETGMGAYEGPRAGEKLYLDVWISDDIGDTFAPGDDTIEYVNAAGELGYEIEILAREHTTEPDTIVLEATLPDGGNPPTPVQLAWIVDGGTPVYSPEFVVKTTGTCNGRSGQYQVESIEGIDLSLNPVVELRLPATLIGGGQFDPAVDLEVDLEHLCYGDTQFDDVWVDVRGTKILPDGTLTGAGIGATSIHHQMNGPIYQQLGVCALSENGGLTPSAAEVDARWNTDTQRWENSNQWLVVQRMFEPDAACHPVNDLGELGCSCDAGTCDGGLTCLHDLCIDETCDPLDEFCGLHLLETGADWELLRYRVEYEFRRDGGFPPIDLSEFAPAPNALPDADPATSSCYGYNVVIDDDELDAIDNVAIVVDYSNSMTQTWNYVGDSEVKLEWAKKAVAGYVKSYVGPKPAGTIHMSLFKFNLFPLRLIEQSLLVTDNPDPMVPETAPAEVAAALDVEATGSTSIGDAIIVALTELPDESLSGTSNGIFLLTDGVQTSGVHTVLEGCEAARDAGAQVFVAPIGNFNASDFACVPHTGGRLVGPIKTDEMSSALFEMRTEFESQQLSLDYKRSELAQDIAGLDQTITYEIPVELGAEALSIQVSPQLARRHTWELEFTLTGPQSETIEHDDTQYVELDPDGYFYTVRVPNPSEGVWELELRAPNMGTPKLVPEAQTVMARVEHAGPRCHVTTSKILAESAQDKIEFAVQATWNGVIHEGVDYNATVYGPDGSSEVVAMTVGEDGQATGQVTDFARDGLHRIQVTCNVADTATYALGETDEGGPGTTTTTVPDGFYRVSTTTFIVDAGLFPTPGGDICDDDGLSDTLEGTGDPDNDGWPNYCDEDSDNDELPDVLETAGDYDGDGLYNIVDSDADDDGEADGGDWDHLNALSYLLHTVGDFDGDGHQDRLWGEPDYDSGRGRIVVEYADDSTPDYWHRDTAGILGTAAVDDNFGAVVVAGDFNDDGYDDVAIGAPLADFGGLTQAGEIHIIYGSSGGLTSIGDQLWNTDSAGMYGIGESDEYFGSRMAVGDFNCDGYDDIVVGMPDEVVGSVDEAGVIHAIYGSSGGITSTGNDLYYQGYSGANGTPEANDRFGETLAVGDFDNDTCSDVVIGVPGQDSGATNAVGEAYVMYGDSSTGVTSTGDWTFTQGTVAGTAAANDRFGTRLWAFDVDSNGYDDVVVMTPGDCSANEKGFNYVYGGSSGLSTSGNTHTCEEVLP